MPERQKFGEELSNDKMNNWPTISIVTPSLNQAAYIGRAIESVATQSYPAIEHLIMDAVSDDGTVDILQRSPSVTWTSESDRGQSDALNKGFLRASGDLIGWLNADDCYLPGAFESVARYLVEHPAADVVYGDIIWIDQEGEPIETRPSLNFDLFSLRYLHWLAIPSTATFFRSEIVHAGLLLDVGHEYAMDYDFFLRIANAGYRFAHMAFPVAEFRLQQESKSSQYPQQQLREHRDAALKHNRRLAALPRFSRAPVWCALSLVARTRRVSIRAVAGHYRAKMRPGTRPAVLGRVVPWDHAK